MLFSYAVEWIQDLLEDDPSMLDEDLLIDPMTFIDEEEEKRDWEERYQMELAAAQEEMDELERMPLLTYSSEDANRTWHGRDGQPMPLWTPPTPSMTGETDLTDHHLSFLYKTRLMDESELPPIFVKKEASPPPLANSSSMSSSVAAGLKRTASEAGFGPELGSQGGLSSAIGASDQKMSKYRKDDSLGGGSSILGASTAGGGFAPRSLFERPQAAIPKSTKIRNRVPNRHLPPGVGVHQLLRWPEPFHLLPLLPWFLERLIPLLVCDILCRDLKLKLKMFQSGLFKKTGRSSMLFVSCKNFQSILLQTRRRTLQTGILSPTWSTQCRVVIVVLGSAETDTIP